jgi:hypothetical protein
MRPILFSGAMVRAILEGRKWQSRRIVSPGPPDNLGMSVFSDGWRYEGVDYRGDAVERCPYGVPGDRLWLRETWRGWCPDSEWCVRYASDASVRENLASWDEGPHYHSPEDAGLATEPHKWRPSIFMPRWASRITLELTDVRVQRLQEISEEDAKAEGIQTDDMNHVVRPDGINWGGARGEFAALWESINVKRAPWDSNPYVWALTFKVLA